MKSRGVFCALLLTSAWMWGMHAQSAEQLAAADDAIPVTAENFIRAESDMYIAALAKNAGGLGKLKHNRELASIENQIVVRPNRDTLYSSAVFDLHAGPVTISFPKHGTRFMSLQIINEDQYVPAVYYRPGAYTFTEANVGTRYMVIGIRTFVDPLDPKDMEQAHALQDAVAVSQNNSGKLELPKWDVVSQKKVRDALLVLGSTMSDFKRAFGTREQVDPVRRLVGSAVLWGANPDTDAMYLNYVPPKNDGTTVYQLDVKAVPVDAFWSVSVYNAQGFFDKNSFNAYTVNDLMAKKSSDGAIRIQFGGCDGKVFNCLPIMSGWNYTVRLFRPRAEILNGEWSFPQPQTAE